MTIGRISKMMRASVKRKEDPRLITGQGKYTDDLKLVGMLYLYVLRSPHAHARINSIDVSKAKAVPGVRAVVTGAEIKALVNGTDAGGCGIPRNEHQRAMAPGD